MSDEKTTAPFTVASPDPRIDVAAKALAWRNLTPKGRTECDWKADFSEAERGAFRAQARIVMEAIGVI